MSFADKHIEITTEGMDPSEQRAFDLGYIAAIQSFVEEIQHTKVNISTTMLNELDELTAKRKLELQSRLALLDVYSEHYGKRLERLAKEM